MTFVTLVPRPIAAQTPHPMFPLATRTVTAAFARERDAGYAVGLIASATDIDVRFTRRNVLNERGEVEMVVLEATLADPTQSGRVATCMVGAHGVRIQPEGAAAEIAHAS